MAAQSSVTPSNTVSVPGLELLGAVLFASLCNNISMELTFAATCYFRTDSTITYFWIRDAIDIFKIFIRNRIQKIRILSYPLNWFHYHAKDSPADQVTRALKVSELNNNNVRWDKLIWLKQDNPFWPKLDNVIDKVDIYDSKSLELKTTLF